MYNPSGVSTMAIRELYLEHRWPPTLIAQHLGCTYQVVNHRLTRTGARTDPRAATPFCQNPVQAPMTEYTLPDLLREYMARAGCASYGLGQVVEVHNSYIRRVLLGQRSLGSELCGRVAAALHLSVLETDRLYVAAGHTPPTLLRLGGWTDTLARICAALLEEEG